MKFFLDSAKLDEISYAIEHWKIDGITTNPRHLANAGLKVSEFASQIKNLIKGTDISVSIEVNPHLTDAKEIMKEARYLASLCENFVIKIPATESGFEALAQLSKEGIKVNTTLVFTVFQAVNAARLGAHIISLFVGWREERGETDTDLIAKVVKAVKNYNYQSKILVAAIRSSKHIADAALAGADIVTASWEVYKRAFENPYVELGLNLFKESWNKLGGM
ncbi:transaldolase family protein [Pseudothermotoga sp.]|uniref:transaldolase family protein n=1 Tax=Pseudothermotoga sp. TaxID=2033661 RepID=UPI0031F6F9F0